MISRQIQQHLTRREFVEAEKLIAQELRQDSMDPEALYFKGVSAYLQGKLGKAIQFLKKTLDQSPQHTDAAICLSILYNDIGKYDEAKKVFRQANHTIAHQTADQESSIDRKFSVKHGELADLYFRYRRYDEAIEQYNKAILLDPSEKEGRISRAKAYAKKGFVTRAFQELQELKSQHPNSMPARLQLGLLHFSQGNVLDAEIEWEKVIEMDPKNQEARAYLERAKKARNS